MDLSEAAEQSSLEQWPKKETELVGCPQLANTVWEFRSLSMNGKCWQVGFR